MNNFVYLTLIIYIPFHLLEEALGDFPKWMYEHHWLPYHMSHGHWMANNVFIYYPLLLISLFFFIFFDYLICFGIGILMWGLINFFDHFFYTWKDHCLSFGLFTGVCFLVNSLFGLYQYVSTDGFSMIQMCIGLCVGAVLFGLPILLCKLLYPMIDRFIK